MGVNLDGTYILNHIWKLNEANNLVCGEEDNGGNLVTHLIFRVHKNNFKIYRYDAVEDTFGKIDH